MQAHAPIHAMIRVQTINLKTAKDADGEEITVAELKVVTEDLAAATQLGWAIRKFVQARFELTQPPLPIFGGQELLPEPARTTVVDENGFVDHTALDQPRTREEQIANLDARDEALAHREVDPLDMDAQVLSSHEPDPDEGLYSQMGEPHEHMVDGKPMPCWDAHDVNESEDMTTDISDDAQEELVEERHTNGHQPNEVPALQAEIKQPDSWRNRYLGGGLWGRGAQV